MCQAVNNNKEWSLISKDELEQLEKSLRFFTTSRGNRIAFYEYGDPNGKPLVFYHGTGSHIHGMLLHKSAIKHHFRIIAPDRPGVGRSEFRSNWTVLEYAEDMAGLADFLGIGKFGIVGISGAGPSLLATALRFPERLECVVDLACAMPLYQDAQMLKEMGTLDRFYAFLARNLPPSLFRIPFAFLGITQKLLKSPRLFAKMFDSSLCAEDKQIFAIEEFQYLFMRDFQELFRHGSKGPAYDALNIYRSWGFELSDIKTHIEVFHGTADKFVPLSFSEYLKSKAPDVTIREIENAGHFHHLVYADTMLAEIKSLYY